MPFYQPQTLILAIKLINSFFKAYLVKHLELWKIKETIISLPDFCRACQFVNFLQLNLEKKIAFLCSDFEKKNPDLEFFLGLINNSVFH
ncbi:hypothetical protein BpHYR1_039543 [Brachionus plicatilis]|uniref:Uncharacterized protein n=1 Tax=Brachionus plicatilis TaxID=10195 RepID=A0A3M7SSK3_BRAPC|nr:hypothetical protein BpHYR1_039543 [Brachionus plicatilis]